MRPLTPDSKNTNDHRIIARDSITVDRRCLVHIAKAPTVRPLLEFQLEPNGRKSEHTLERLHTYQLAIVAEIERVFTLVVRLLDLSSGVQCERQAVGPAERHLLRIAVDDERSMNAAERYPVKNRR